jgi:hypothetical protein
MKGYWYRFVGENFGSLILGIDLEYVHDLDFEKQCM